MKVTQPLENRTQEWLVYLKWLRYLLWLLRLHFARTFERENKTLFITGRRAAAGKLLRIECWQVVRLCDWLCEQVVMFPIGCADCGWFVWGGGRGSPPSTLWSTNWTQHLVISALSFIHPLRPAVCALDCPWDPLIQCVCVYFGLIFELGSGKTRTQRGRFFFCVCFCFAQCPCKLKWMPFRTVTMSFISLNLLISSPWWYGHWHNYGSLWMCVHSSVFILSASAFSVYSPCLFLVGLIVPFQTIRCLLECTSYCAWEWDWAGCSYFENAEVFVCVMCEYVLHQRENVHCIIKLNDIITIIGTISLVHHHHLPWRISSPKFLFYFLFTHPHFFPNLYDFLSFCGTQ